LETRPEKYLAHCPRAALTGCRVFVDIQHRQPDHVSENTGSDFTSPLAIRIVAAVTQYPELIRLTVSHIDIQQRCPVPDAIEPHLGSTDV